MNWISPLSFDINGDGVKTTSITVDYDIDADGVVDKINDSADYVLAFDADGDGVSGENGSELFGDMTDIDGDGFADGYVDGFAALKALALQHGLISDVDTTLDENDLKLLCEKAGLRLKAGYNGEAKTFEELDITSINLAKTNSTTLKLNFDGLGNNLMTQEGATFTINGEEHTYADIWHKKQDEE